MIDEHNGSRIGAPESLRDSLRLTFEAIPGGAPSLPFNTELPAQTFLPFPCWLSSRSQQRRERNIGIVNGGLKACGARSRIGRRPNDTGEGEEARGPTHR